MISHFPDALTCIQLTHPDCCFVCALRFREREFKNGTGTWACSCMAGCGCEFGLGYRKPRRRQKSRKIKSGRLPEFQVTLLAL